MATGLEARLPDTFDEFDLDTSALIKFSELEMEHKVGEGGFSQVYRGMFHGKLVAIKRMKIEFGDRVEMAYLQGELTILKNVRHPNLLQYYGASVDGSTIYVVTEFAEYGDVCSLIWKRYSDISEKFKHKIAKESAAGISYLHSQHIIHRDIKPQNLLIDDHYCCKVCDFGFARKSNTDIAMTYCGTDEYMAPEIYMGESYDEAADLFSLGVTLIALFAGRLPSSTFLQRIPSQRFKIDRDEARKALPSSVPDTVVELLYRPDTMELFTGLNKAYEAIPDSALPLLADHSKAVEAKPVEVHKKRLDDVLMTGLLRKKGPGFLDRWTVRFFVLRRDSISYYENEELYNLKQTPKGTIAFSEIWLPYDKCIEMIPEEENQINLITQRRKFRIAFSSPTELASWKAMFEQTLKAYQG